MAGLPFKPVYDGDGGAAGGAAAGEPPPPVTPPAPKAGEPPVVNKDDKKVSQKKVNELLAEEKRKHQAIINKQVTELEKLKASKTTGELAKQELQARIDDLNKSLMTREEVAAQEKKELQDAAQRERELLSGERDSWKGMYHDTEITNSLTDAALKHEAYNAKVLVNLLKPLTRLTQATDKDGNPIPKQYVPKVELPDTDKDGNPITLTLSPLEAVKRMKDRADEYGNLFKSGVAGGLGQSGGRSGKQVNLNTMSPEEYRKWRQTQEWTKKKGNAK